MKVVICGAGIAGLSLAQRLSSIGWDVVVIEKSAGPRDQGYMMDFFGLGYDAAQYMGLLPRLQELSYRAEEVCYVDEGGRRRAGLNYARFERAVNGWLLASCALIWSWRFASWWSTRSICTTAAASRTWRTRPAACRSV